MNQNIYDIIYNYYDISGYSEEEIESYKADRIQETLFIEELLKALPTNKDFSCNKWVIKFLHMCYIHCISSDVEFSEVEYIDPVSKERTIKELKDINIEDFYINVIDYLAKAVEGKGKTIDRMRKQLREKNIYM